MDSAPSYASAASDSPCASAAVWQLVQKGLSALSGRGWSAISGPSGNNRASRTAVVPAGSGPGSSAVVTGTS